MSDEGLAYIIKSLKNEFGISLNFLKSRYEKYQDLTNNSPPSQLSVEEYSEIIGINPELDHELLWIAYQASCASLPEG